MQSRKHESTKGRKGVPFLADFFRVFALSCFRDCICCAKPGRWVGVRGKSLKTRPTPHPLPSPQRGEGGLMGQSLRMPGTRTKGRFEATKPSAWEVHDQWLTR